MNAESKQVDTLSGLIAGARQLPSPNADDRPPETLIDLVVVHGISLPPGEFGGPWIDALFCNDLPADAHPYFEEVCELQVSAHACIRRDGEVVQYVPFHRRAWHAGVSSFDGRDACNDFSVGIELEGADDIPYTESQYDALAQLCIALMNAYPAITRQRIVGHCDIAPGRKTDPGEAFDWECLFLKLQDSPQ